MPHGPSSARRPPRTGSGADALARPATRREVEELHERGLLTHAARCDALELLCGDVAARWGRTLGGLGALLVSSGGLLLACSRWAEIGRHGRLAAVGAGLVACLVVAQRRGRPGRLERAALGGAIVLVGAVLLVVESAFPTGAPAWSLLAWWAFLTAPWAALSRCLAHLLGWLAVGQLAVGAWWLEVVTWRRPGFPSGLCLSLAAADAAVLAALVLLPGRGMEWLDRRWARRAVLAALLSCLLAPAASIARSGADAGPLAWVAAALLAASVALAAWLFSVRRPDGVALAIALGAGGAALLTLAGWLALVLSQAWWAALAFGLSVTGVTVALSAALDRAPRSREEAGRADTR